MFRRNDLDNGIETIYLIRNGTNLSEVMSSELKTLEWDILNPDRLINLEINDKRRTSVI